MKFIDLVALVALVQLFFFWGLVGRARGTYEIKAPAVTGHQMFERAYRVQMNTIELLVLLLPALYLAAKYWAPIYSAIAGSIYIVGRFIYWRTYMSAPESRQLGVVLSIGPIVVLLIASFVGIIRS